MSLGNSYCALFPEAADRLPATVTQNIWSCQHIHRSGWCLSWKICEIPRWKAWIHGKLHKSQTATTLNFPSSVGDSFHNSFKIHHPCSSLQIADIKDKNSRKCLLTIVSVKSWKDSPQIFQIMKKNGAGCLGFIISLLICFRLWLPKMHMHTHRGKGKMWTQAKEAIQFPLRFK